MPIVWIIYLLKANPLRRLLVSTSNCACLFNAFRDGTSSSSSERGAAGVAQDGNLGNNGPPLFARIVLPSTEVVAIDIVSTWKTKAIFMVDRLNLGIFWISAQINHVGFASSKNQAIQRNIHRLERVVDLESYRFEKIVKSFVETNV